MQRRMLPALFAISLSSALATGCQTDAITSAPDASSSLTLKAAAHGAGDSPAAVNAALAEIRRVTAPYHNVDNAIAAGYVIDARCISNPTLGAMGYHAPSPFRDDAAINLLEPDMLLYERQPSGEYRLNGVEYFVLKSTWDAAHGGATAAPPTLFGRDVPLSDHPPFGEHYELHVWVFKHNPSGMFASWNPRVSCP